MYSGNSGLTHLLTVVQFPLGLMCIHALWKARQTSKSKLTVTLITHILVLELLNTVTFMTATLGIPLLVYLQDLPTGRVPDEDKERLASRLRILFYLSNIASVACSTLTDGILVGLLAIFNQNINRS